MLIASLVTSCLTLFLHAGACPEGSLPGLSSVQPEVHSSEFQVRFQFANEQQPEDGPRGGERERGMRNGAEGRGEPSNRGGFGGPEGRGGDRPMGDRAQGDHGPDVQRLLQRIEQLEQQLHERQGLGRGERATGGQPPSRENKREAKRGSKRGEMKGGMQGHRGGPESGPRGGRQAGPQNGAHDGPRGGRFGGMGGRGIGGRGMGGGGMGGGPGGMLPLGGPEMLERRGEMLDQMRDAFRERVGQRLPEIRERIIERAGPGGPEGRGGPHEEIRIERRGGPDRGPVAGGMGGPNERRIPKEGVEIRVEERREGNAGPQDATEPRLERILHMVERLNERLDRLEKQASHSEAPMPQDRPGDAPRPRGPQGGGRGGPEAGSGGGR